MTRPEQGPPDLRVAVPTLEPDDLFLARLSTVAAATSVPPARPAPVRAGWRAALAAASVAAVVGGGAWAVTSLSTDEQGSPTSPVTRPTSDDPEPLTGQGTAHGSRDHRPGDGRPSDPGPDDQTGGTEQSPASTGTDGPGAGTGEQQDPPPSDDTVPEQDAVADPEDAQGDDDSGDSESDSSGEGDETDGPDQGDESDGSGDESDGSGDDSGSGDASDDGDA